MNSSILELSNINHDTELYETNQFINNLKKEINETPVNDEVHNVLFEKIIRALLHLGSLSQKAFIHTDQVEEHFFQTYEHKKARKEWLEFTNSIHKKYDQQKNRCFKLIDILDQKYYSKFKKEPQNWMVNEMPLLDYINFIKS